MALVIKCRDCRARVKDRKESCPACGSTRLRFMVEYYPAGRWGGKQQKSLPEKITTVKEALAWERVMVAAGKKKKSRRAEALTTVEDFFPDYLEWYKLHRAPTSWHDINGAWERDLRRIFGKYLVTEIEASNYSAYQKVRGQVSNRTINKELDYFSGFLRWLRREKKIEIPRIDYDRLPYKRPIPIVLSPEEVVRILEAAETEPVYHALILCLYTLGLRISEARGMKLEDFDFGNRTARVVQKGGAWKVLPVNDAVVAAVERVVKLRGVKPGQFVFSIQKGGEPVQNVRKAILRICKRAEVVKKVHPHLFRHSIATHLLGADVNMKTIQLYLGHTQMSTTAEIYTHVAMGNLRAAQGNVVPTRIPSDSGGDPCGCEYNI